MRDEDVRPRDAAPAKEALQPLKEASPSLRSGAVELGGSKIEAETVETVEIVAIEDALPVIDSSASDAPIKLGAETIAAKSKVESDTARIEAQLTELLSEDLNALRQNRPSIETSASDKPADGASTPEVSDPFAFDLGPSPFAPKPEPQQPIAAAPVFKPAPIVTPSQPISTPSPTPTISSAPVTPAVAAVPPPPVAPQPTSPAPKSRQTFVIPSVSATLGPTRKLEPLSHAFEPIPPPPASVMESFSPIAEPPPPITRSNQPDDTVVRSGLPATASDSGLDRPMEDAMADLLRPLLKTWLAENMPKIVERALRREMSERLLPGQKNPLK